MFGPLFCSPLLGATTLFSLFGSDWITSGLTIAACVFAFVGLKNGGGGSSPPAGRPLARLRERAGTLLQHVQSLGFPALAPLVGLVAQGNWAAIPAAFDGLLNQLDDKTQRGGILDALFAAQLERHLNNPERREALTQKLRSRGFSITPPTA